MQKKKLKKRNKQQKKIGARKDFKHIFGHGQKMIWERTGPTFIYNLVKTLETKIMQMQKNDIKVPIPYTKTIDNNGFSQR